MNRCSLSLLSLFALACRAAPGDGPRASHPVAHDAGGTSGDSATGPHGDAAIRDAGDAAVHDGGAARDAQVPTGEPCRRPGTLCWDFEEGNLPRGFTPARSEFSGALLVDATRAHGGRYALHARDLVGGVEGQQGGPKHTVRYELPRGFGPVLWGRAFVYTTPARPASHAGLFNARYPRPGSQSTAFDTLDWYEVATYTERYMVIWHPPEPPGYPEWVKVSDTPLALDRWVCLEWLFDGENGGADQAADPRLWLDGVELGWPEQFVFSEPPGAPRPFQEKATDFTVFETGAYLYQGLSTETSFWIDDLAVAPERIGCD